LAKRFWLGLTILIAFLSSCTIEKGWQTSTFIYFDTVCEVKIHGTPAQFSRAKEAVHQVFSEIETLFSPGSNDYSSPQVIRLFKNAFKVYAASDGDFDISVAPLVKLWGFYDRSYRIPTSQEIQQILARVDMKMIRQDESGIHPAPDMELDWGGIAAGYGVDLAAQALKELGISRGFINAGGDLYCWGTNPDKNAWQVGIKHPRRDGFLGILSLRDEGAATTGDYQRFFIREGVRYHHVFDPHSGYPRDGKQSVTVVGPEAVFCDALATALFVSDQPDSILRSFPDYGAVIVDAAGRLNKAGKIYPLRPSD